MEEKKKTTLQTNKSNQPIEEHDFTDIDNENPLVKKIKEVSKVTEINQPISPNVNHTNKTTHWYENKYNLTFIAILLFAFIIRIYFFYLTKSQPLWWDEAVYGSLAKNLALGGPWSNTFLIEHETFIRPMLFPILWSAFLKLGFQEVGVRFFLQFLPSMVAVAFVYLIGKELYSKKTALIATFIFSTIWVHLFYTSRLLTSVPALLFLFPSFYFFIKSLQQEFNPKYFALSIFLLSLSTLIRYPIGLLFFSYLAFIILTKPKLLLNKKFYISGIMGIIPILIFFLLSYMNYGSIFPELLSGEYYGKETGQPKPPIAFNILRQIPNYLQTSFFVLFLIGSALTLFELVIGFSLRKRSKKIKSHLFNFLLFTIFYSFFIFSARAAEDRYLLPISITFVLMSGIGGEFIYKIVKKYTKEIALIVILLILALGAFQELKVANKIIIDKKSSFLYERQGFEWVSQNTPRDSVMLGRGTGPYSLYYAERTYLEPPPELDPVFMENIKADYFIVNMYRPPRNYMIQWLQENQEEWVPIHAIFFDEQQQQPAFIVYKHQPKTQ